MNSGWLLIDGLRQTGGGPEFVSLNPATSDVIWEGHAASNADVQRAMAAARRAQADWAWRPFAEREAIVRHFAGLLEQQRESLSAAISEETGKPLWDAAGEVSAMIGKIDLAVRALQERAGEQETQAAGIRTRLQHRPQGVVAVFGPYNFPGHLPNGHIVPALLAGNCVLFKPSELTPKVAELTVALWEAAGIPAGVLQLLQGERATGEAIAHQADLNGLFFTGSSRTGLLLQQQFAAHPQKILALEMGGNNPLLIGQIGHDPGAIKAAVHDVLQSAYLSSGQRCTCARRLLVADDADGQRFVDALCTAIDRLRVDAPDADPPPFMGPMISVRAAEQILAAQTRLIALGAEALRPVKRLRLGAAFLSPGLIDVSAVDALPDEEYFGPLLQLIRYRRFEQAVERAGRTRYGLAAALLSQDATQWDTVCRHLRVGLLNWNRPTTGASSALPFGGVGYSGNHRPSAYYAADYCAYPVAMSMASQCTLPKALAPGIEL